VSSFHRSGHYRTNSQGTTFWVNGHGVSRDDWPYGVSRPSREILISYKGTSYGITYPNARCPVCSKDVFFFAAHNGGRVFFDPPLGPPWPKHPCTISEKATLSRTTVPEEQYVESQQVESLSYEVYPQLTGSVIVLEIDGQEKAYSTLYEFEQPHLERVWPITNSRGAITALSLLTVEFEPVELPVRARRLPVAMSQSTRRKLASKGLENIAALMSRINPAPSAPSDQHSFDSGSHAVWIGDVATVFVPIPVDHRWTLTEADCQMIREYMYQSASEALTFVTQRRPAKRSRLAPKDMIVFCFDDCLGALRSNNAWYLGLEYRGGVDPDETRRHSKPWLRSLDARVAWIDTLSTEEIVMPDGRITIEETLEIEAEFCASRWPEGEYGRWRKIQEMTAKLGVGEHFQALVRGLREQEWLLASRDDYEPLTYELVFARKTGEATPRFRLLLSLSSTAGLAIVAGWAEESQPVEEFLVHVKTGEQLMSLLKNLARNS
jgi:hypothetical protein